MSLRAQAADLPRLAAADPAAAHARSRVLLARAEAAGDGAAEVLALRGAGLAAKELGLLEEGVALLRRALARSRGYDAALVRMNLVGLLAARGDVRDALTEAARAEGVLKGADADRLSANLACALARSGRVVEADRVASLALPRLRRDGDPVTLSGLLTNLGLARALTGDLDTAEGALAEAVAAGEAAGAAHLAAMARANLAFVASRRGDLPRALRLFAAAEPALTGERVAQCRFDLAETLIQAGLPGEARPLLTATLAEVAAHGYRCDVADGLLLLAHAELAGGDPERAAETAERARAAFASQERTGWMLLAEHVLLRARWAAGDRSAVFLRTAVATADRLQEGGWADTAAEARIIAARIALELGRPAGHLLEPVARARERGPAALRAAAWHATALELYARSDEDGARAAIDSGLRVVEEYAEVFGALELRARAAGLGEELAGFALLLARSAEELFQAEERRRAAVRPVSLRPPPDPDRAAALSELRALSARRAAALADGGEHAGEGAGEVAALERLEASIRARTRTRGGGGTAGPFGGSGLEAALGDRTLAELIRVGDGLHAVIVRQGRMEHSYLASYEEVLHHVRLAGFALRRLTHEGDDSQSRSGLTRTCEHLNKLLAPLDGDSQDLVIAPTGPLHAFPWALLPVLRGRPYTLVPSAAAWVRARSADTPRPSRRAVLAAGPGLAHAHEEVQAVHRLHPGARSFIGPAARAEAVRDALQGADLAHLAAHGEFRDGNMLFSRLRLADGPLMLCDLEELELPPRLVVLSACDLGRTGREDQDAVTGMVGTLLALGTATVVASVAPVRDADAPPFMTAFHGLLADGVPPARALAALPRPPGLAGLNCYGAG